MNPAYFSLTGYLSVILWICVLVLWCAHKFVRPRRWLCHIALVCALLAFVCAKINSVSYVNRIQLDRTEELAAWEAKQEAARKAAEESRGGDVAQIRFAEDARSDFLDTAGMDEADLKYFEKAGAATVPDWKKGKKERSEGAAEDDSLEGLIGGTESSDGMDSESLDDAKAAAPVTMVADDLAMAQRLDKANLQLTRILMLLGIVVVIVDYLRRANSYDEAYFPLRLPSAWLNAFTPLPAVVERPASPRRTLPEELAWLRRRGDVFLYVGAGTVPDDVLRITNDMDDDFVFEALWYGRSSFAVDSAERAEPLLALFAERFEQRRATRAAVAQTVHVVWDLDRSDRSSIFPVEARSTGFSLFLCKG